MTEYSSDEPGTKEATDVLELNSKLNNRWATAIIAIYITAFGSVIPRCFTEWGVISSSDPWEFVRRLAVLAFLGILSIVAIAYYFRLVQKIQEKPIGNIISVCLAGWLFILLHISVSVGALSLVTLGLVGIGAKSLQLLKWSENELQSMEASTSRVFFIRVWRTYLVSIGIALILGVLVDANIIQIQSTPVSSNYEYVQQELQGSTNSIATDKEKALQALNNLEDGRRNATDLYRGLFAFILVQWIFLLLIFLVRIMLGRIALEEVLEELRKFYESKRRVAKDASI